MSSASPLIRTPGNKGEFKMGGVKLRKFPQELGNLTRQTHLGQVLLNENPHDIYLM